jgi:DNA-binding response OmpR family regulator
MMVSYRLDPAARVLSCGEQSLQLRRQQAKMLQAIVYASPQAASYERIIHAMWDGRDEPDWAMGQIQSLMCRMRHAMEKAFQTPPTITAIYGIGYRLDTPVCVINEPEVVTLSAEIMPKIRRLLESHPDAAEADRVLERIPL